MQPKCSKDLYCQFLIAAQTDYTATGMSDGYQGKLAHDAVTRWQRNTKLTPAQLWDEVEPLVRKDAGFLVIDDMTIEKNRSYSLPMSSWHWSGSAHDVVRGLNVVNMLWTAGEEHIPVDFRLYTKSDDGMTRNQHVHDMLHLAKHREFNPKAVVFDTWYSSQANLNLIQGLNWIWYAPLRENRIVNYTTNLKNLEFTKEELITGKQVQLKLVGQIRVFKFIAKDGDIEYWATNNLDATSQDASEARVMRWNVEEFHRALKQTTGINKCQARNNRAQRTHIFCSIRSFIVLECYRLKTKTTWYEAKKQIIREAIQIYLTDPLIPLPDSMVSA